MDADEAGAACEDVLVAVEDAVIARRPFLETVLLALLARGHALIEDVPGTGKTLTARSVADALGLSFSRIQFTPDLLPTDVTGTHVFDEGTGEFEFSAGPVFANVVLADELNRAPPKTQSALLEAMEEGQVTVDGETHPLPEPFFVIATQNPVESEGVFPLPAAQLDRFAVRTAIGYPGFEAEAELLRRRADREARSPSVDPVLSVETVRELQRVPERVRVEEDLLAYILEVARATREDHRVEVGVSPRGSQRLFETARARAAIAGRGFVTPDDVKTIAPAVLAHRLVLTPDARVSGDSQEAIVESVLDATPVPTV